MFKTKSVPERVAAPMGLSVAEDTSVRSKISFEQGEAGADDGDDKKDADNDATGKDSDDDDEDSESDTDSSDGELEISPETAQIFFYFDIIEDIFLQIFSAVAYIHGKGIVHRDLKPQNILMMNSKDQYPVHVCICDFGLAE